MTTLRFDYRDLFRSPRLAFSFQRLWIQFLGLLGGYIVYTLLTYAAFLIGGESLSDVWSRFGLMPCAFGMVLPWTSWVVFGLGLAAFILIWLITATAVSRATYMNLKGNTFYSWKEAIAFALKKTGSVAVTPIAILVILFIVSLGGVVVGLFGRIPVGIGDVLGIGISLLTPIWYAASIFLVFVALALGISLLLTPAILATTDDDAFEGIFQSFSILASQPWRLIVYEILIEVLSIVGFLVFAFFAKKAWGVMTTILMWGMGDKFSDISFSATNMVQNWVLPVVNWIRYFLGESSSLFLFSHELTVVDLPVIASISSVILAVFVFLIGFFLVSYPFATFNAGNTLLFLILKKKKDDENLLERKDKEEETEEDKKEDAEKVEDEAAPAAKKTRVRKPARKASPARKKTGRSRK